MAPALILFLLGFGALAAGVLIGRYYVPDDRMTKRTARHAKSYMRAINHLLARDHEAAIDELRGVLSENVDEIEPYFALGALFRGRDEWERAIRVHQAIELREGASKKIRLRARYELGLDFRAAGMPRRATRAMEDCVAMDSKHEGALRALCGLYEEQGRYAEAASAWKRLDKLRGADRHPREHHLLVAAAQRAIATGDTDSAKRLIRDAGKLREESAHAHAAAAELAAARDNFKGATAQLEKALAAAPDLAPFFIHGLVEAERQQVAAELAKEQKKADSPLSDEALAAAEDERTFRRVAEILGRLAEDGARSPHLLLAAADMRSHYDPTGALADYRAIADDFEDLLPARVAAGRLALAGDDAGEIQTELSALVGDDGALAWASDGVWRCGFCGHRDDAFFWRCEGCRRWGTVRLDVGRAAQEPPPPPPRERREVPRGGPSQALLGAASDNALPEPALDSGLSDDELADAGRRPSLLGRVGSFFTSPFKKKDKPPQLGE
jgi:lipopolysaccharide biosynthesis regulator YciM